MGLKAQYFHGQNKSKIIVSILRNVRPKKSININVRNMSILALNHGFLIQNRQKVRFFYVSVKERVVL